MQVICTRTGGCKIRNKPGEADWRNVFCTPVICDGCNYFTAIKDVEVEPMTPEVAERFGLAFWQQQSAEDWAAHAFSVEQERDDLERSLLALASRFEEVCGELAEAKRQSEVIPLPCPGPGWYWVRGHWRSRAQNSAAIDPDQGTVQAAPGEGQTGASGEATGHSPEGADPQIRDAYCRGRSGIPLGNWCNESQSGDATGADKEQPCPGCGSYRGTHGLGCRILALTQSGEERSE